MAPSSSFQPLRKRGGGGGGEKGGGGERQGDVKEARSEARVCSLSVRHCRAVPRRGDSSTSAPPPSPTCNTHYDLPQFARISSFQIQANLIAFQNFQPDLFPFTSILTQRLLSLVTVQRCNSRMSPDNTVISVQTLCLFISLSLSVYTIGLPAKQPQ